MLWALCAVAILQDSNTPAESGRHKDGIEVVGVYVAVTICEDVAVTRLSMTLQNWRRAAAEADLQFAAPKGAAVCEFDYEGEVTPDTESVLDVARAKALYEKLTAKARRLAKPGLVRTTVRRIPLRSPELLTQESDTVYRLRLFPIGPGDEEREYAQSPEGAILNPAAPKRTQVAGGRQTADVLVVSRLRRNGGEFVYEFPIQFGGNVSKIPAIDVDARVVSCGEIEAVKSDTDELTTVRRDGDVVVDMKDRGEGALNLRVRYASKPHDFADAEHACEGRVRYAMDWAESCLETQDPLKSKVVTRKTAILLAAGEL